MNVTKILGDLTSHAKKLGIFNVVNLHEPKNAPPNGLNCSIWAESIGPAVGGSGLDVTTAYVVMNVRLYSKMTQQPYDGIDPAMLSAVDKLMSEYSGAFSLGGDVRAVDLYGMYGETLQARAGYIEQDRVIYRVFTITLPLIVNDTWQEAP